MKIQVIASGSSGNAYLVSDGYTSLLLDVGIGIAAIQKAVKFKLTSINGALITHVHQDHAKSSTVKDLLNRGICIYTSQGTIDALNIDHHNLIAVKELKRIEIGSWYVLPFDVVHDAPEPLGFVITSKKTKEKLLYFTDTAYLKYKFNGITHLLAEANYSFDAMRQTVLAGDMPNGLGPRIIKNHMSIETLIDFLKANNFRNLSEIHLLHLSSANSDAALFKEMVQEVSGVPVYTH